jgi:hypothetical protein
LRNEELRNLFSAPNVIKVVISVRIILAAHVACTRAEYFIHGIGRKTRLGRPLQRWEYNIRKILTVLMYTDERHML